MIIQHLKYPFHHTIIYNFFDGVALDEIKQEVLSLVPMVEATAPKDTHHEKLLSKTHTLSLGLDEVFAEDRDKSKIISFTREIFNLCNQGILQSKDNPFLGYVPTSNYDNTFLQLYKNGSSYFAHQDAAVVTMLYPIFLSKNFEGGNLSFPKHDYTPHLEDNSCLVFPSFEIHALSAVRSDEKGYVRASINQRLCVR